MLGRKGLICPHCHHLPLFVTIQELQGYYHLNILEKENMKSVPGH